MLAFVGLLLISTMMTISAGFKTPPTTISPDEYLDNSSAVATKLSHVADAHLFGSFVNDLNALPQTMLQLTLQGIAYSTDPNVPSRAIIRARSGKTEVYQIGQTVPGGAIIKKIQKDLVVLDDNHQLESLKLPVPKITDDIYTSVINDERE